MNVRISRRAHELLQLRVSKPALCSSCAARRYASTAAAPSTQDPSVPRPQNAQQRSSIPSTASRTNYIVRAGVVLSRPPQITRELHPFEKAFFLYQRRMNERTAMPFPRYFYIHQETPAEIDWKRKIADRKTPARDIGKWSAWDRDQGWNDELLVGSTISEPSEHMQRLLEDAKVHEEAAGEESSEEKVVFEQQSRATDADRSNDTRSLQRDLSRTLYLLILHENGRWQFPSALIEGSESLYRAAERVIVQTGGINMNTWIVGNAPVGHHTWNYTNSRKDVESGLEDIGEKTFFMKGRIMAGNPDLKVNQFGFRDHQWLSRDEIEKLVNPSYWNSIKNMLPSL